MKTRHVAPLLALLAVTSTQGLADEADVCADAAEEGQTLRDRQKLLEARDRFLRCAQSSCPKPVRDDCAPFLEDVKKRLPSIVLRAQDERGEDVTDVTVNEGGALVTRALDGSARDLDPGPHTFRFEAPGYPARETKIIVAEGEQRRIVTLKLTKTVVAPPDVASTSEGQGPLPWIIGGIGVAGLATFGVLQGVAWSEHADVEERCGAAGTCTDDDLDPLRAKFIGSAVGLGVGIAGIGVATVLFLTLGGETERVSARFDGSSGALRFEQRF